ncbi:hypothetical protein F5X68DRAFT_546 [Plectosphaerella plurivora]|uniref:Uncharacterized protein n=1 Tax=Plectosphaerella plurivora TaxID=936078 RepID=A0A9P8VLZ2_9PEZI|nr:hypothetical protein F5X68DRAFT_546 [Plectosphaerella plurivora]
MSLILYLWPIAVAAWLTIGGVAYGNETVAKSPFGEQIVVIAFFAFVLSILFVVLLDDYGTHAAPFATGVIGFGVASFQALGTADAMDQRILFKVFGGLLAGWVVEWTLHPTRRLTARLQRSFQGKA